MTSIPEQTLYHQYMGWHAPALRRAAIVVVIGVIVGLVLLRFAPWQLAVIGGWDSAAVVFLLVVWLIILRADGGHTEHLARREDDTRGAATVLVIGASVVSLLGVGFALGLAGRENGSRRLLLIAVAVVTVVLSWTVINTVYTLRYADLHFQLPAQGIVFGDSTGPDSPGPDSPGPDAPGADPTQPTKPDYRDFAYVAFTIGMTYQVSDTTVRARHTRHTVLSHALMSYVFGVVIVAGAINLVAGLVA
jgi:uncharacterized membrane protein